MEQKAREKSIELAKKDLARRTGIGPEEIDLLEVEAVTWPDSSLGNPDPNKAYIQMLISGFRVILSARGRTFEYHTDSGRVAVMTRS